MYQLNFKILLSYYVPEVLNVHVNESKKKLLFFRMIFYFHVVKN